jgi:hypothetical protein
MLLLNRDEILSLLNPGELIAALEGGFRALSSGQLDVRREARYTLLKVHCCLLDDLDPPADSPQRESSNSDRHGCARTSARQNASWKSGVLAAHPPVPLKEHNTSC